MKLVCLIRAASIQGWRCHWPLGNVIRWTIPAFPRYYLSNSLDRFLPFFAFVCISVGLYLGLHNSPFLPRPGSRGSTKYCWRHEWRTVVYRFYVSTNWRISFWHARWRYRCSGVQFYSLPCLTPLEPFFRPDDRFLFTWNLVNIFVYQPLLINFSNFILDNHYIRAWPLTIENPCVGVCSYGD